MSDEELAEEINAALLEEISPERFGSTMPEDGERPGSDSYETAWSKYLASGKEEEDLKGRAEYKNFDNSRIDILTYNGYSVEVEWLSKWKEAVGQALYYAALQGNKPMIVLLAKGEKTDKLYYMRLMVVAAKHDIKVVVIETNK